MAITYPVTFPTTFGVSNFQIGLDHAVGVTESPFTFEQQVQEHQGTAWEISAVLELLNREQAEEYNAFIASLKGRVGTFLMTIPGSETARGNAGGTPLVNGASQTGQDLITDGWTPSITNIMRAGDFIQLGSGSSTRLHRVLQDVNSDGSGNATLTLAPKIVSDDSPSDDDPITVSNCQGIFRLKSNLNMVDIKPPNQHTIRFAARGQIMSRNLTTNFKNAITAGTVKPVILVEAVFDSETLRFWNGTGTFTYNSNDYTGAGHLLNVSEITETQNIEANGVVFELSGIPSSLLSVALGEDIHDRTVTQTFVALDANDTVIADPFEFFSGKADTIDIEEGSAFSVIKLTAESDLIALNRISERRRTPEDQKLTYSGDTFFDNVASLQSLDIVWGGNA